MSRRAKIRCGLITPLRVKIKNRIIRTYKYQRSLYRARCEIRRVKNLAKHLDYFRHQAIHCGQRVKLFKLTGYDYRNVELPDWWVNNHK